MADESARFSIDLEGNAAAHARDDAEALEQLQEAIQGDIGALRQMQSAFRNLQGSSTVSIATMRNLKDQISAQKAKIAQAQQSYIDLGGKFRKLKPPADEAKFSIRALLEGIRGAPGPVGAFVARLGGMSKLLVGGAIVGGILAIVAAVVALNVVLVAGAAALMRYGIGQANARRSELLHLEALTKLRIGYMGLWAATGRAAMSGKQLQGIIDDTVPGVALARGEVTKYTEQLYKMGLRGQNLKDALEGTAITAATQGDAAAQAFAGWAAGANATGQSVRRLTEDVRARLGPIAKAQLLDINVQSQKLKENLGALFNDVKITKFLEPLAEIVNLFSQQQAIGRALKGIVERIFGGVGNQLGGLTIVVKRFFQGIVIGALLAENGILRLRRWWRKTFGDSEMLKGIDLTKVALYSGVAVVVAFAGALAGAAAAAGMLIAPLYAIYKAGLAVYDSISRASQAVSDMRAKWGQAGKDAGGGLLQGLASTGGPLGVAAAALGAKVLQAFRDKMQIRSPSRKMFELTTHVGGGAVLALRASKPAVARATADLIDTPRRQAARIIPITTRAVARAGAGVRLGVGGGIRPLRPQAEIFRPSERRRRAPEGQRAEPARRMSAAGRAAGGPIVHLTIEHLEIHAGSANPADLESAVTEALERALRKVSAHIGAPAPGVAAA